jgi:hypothetical protein
MPFLPFRRSRAVPAFFTYIYSVCSYVCSYVCSCAFYNSRTTPGAQLAQTTNKDHEQGLRAGGHR